MASNVQNVVRDRFAKPLVEGTARILELLIVALMAVMLATLAWQVFSRFVINLPSVWTEEVARYSFIYMTFFGAALGVKNSTHFGVSLLTDALHGPARDFYFRFVVNGLILLASLLMLIFGSRYAVHYGMARVSPTFHIQMFWLFLVMPLAALPMTVFAAYNICFGGFRAEASLAETATEQQLSPGESTVK